MNQNDKTIGKFCFIMDWPDEVLEAVLPIAEEMQWMIPSWANIATLIWRPRLKSAMTCGIEADYRRIRLELGPPWLDEIQSDRRACFIHELMHGFTLPLEQYARDTINRLLPDAADAKLKGIVLEELRERNEQVTEDLAFCLSRNLMASLDAQPTKLIQ